MGPQEPMKPGMVAGWKSIARAEPGGLLVVAVAAEMTSSSTAKRLLPSVLWPTARQMIHVLSALVPRPPRGVVVRDTVALACLGGPRFSDSGLRGHSVVREPTGLWRCQDSPPV